MRVTVLGSSAGGPSRTNPGSGYLVESGGSSLWMDCGPGTFAALARRVDPMELDAVIVSHVHVDHASDVLALYSHLAWSRGADDPVRVLAPVGVADRLAAFVGVEDRDHAFHRVLAFETVEDGSEAEIGDLSLRFGDAVHPVPAVVTRIDGPSTSLAYSGDTGPGGGLIETAWMADVLVCEASLQGVRTDATNPHHLTAREAGEVASTAGVGELVLTHLSAEFDPQLSIDQASSAFVGTISYAAPGTTFSTDR